MPPNVRLPHPRRAQGTTAAALLPLLAALLAGCATGQGASAPGSSTPAGASIGAESLSKAATGVCLAIASLPDARGAEDTFTNEAHEALHALAAAEGLDRSLAARLLEAMERVEADFEGGAAETALRTDLNGLHAAAGDALAGLGMAAPPCS
jgi:hypothetical protein